MTLLTRAPLSITAVLLGATIGVLFALLHHGPWLGRRAPLVGRIATFVAAVPLLAMAPALTFAVCVRARLVPLPGDPEAGFAGLLFAAGLLAIPLSAHTARVGIAAIDEVKSMPFLRVAAAKGAAPFRVWCLHALAASSGPVIVVVAAQLGALLGGAVVLERLFERPGLGTLILEAYGGRDLPVLEASVVAAGALFVVAQAASGMLDDNDVETMIGPDSYPVAARRAMTGRYAKNARSVTVRSEWDKAPCTAP